MTFTTSSSDTIRLTDHFKKCVVKVKIFILLNCINLLHARFQLEFGVLISFLTGYFIHEPLVVIFVVDIHNVIGFCDSDN